MKIAVLIWRAWSAWQRYRSLLVNAKALGHDVACFGSRWPQGDELIRLALADTGIPFYPLSELAEAMPRFNPDVIFGEAVKDPFEDWAHKWAGMNHKVDLVLDHAQFEPYNDIWDRIKSIHPHITVMTTNKEQEARCLEFGLKAKAVGVSDLDLIKNHYDISAIRERLKVGPKQFLVAFFLDLFTPDLRYLQSAEWECMGPFLREAQQANWKVVFHCHPCERFKANSEGPEGLQWPNQRYMYLRWIQNQGGYFVTDSGPGKVGEIEFHNCGPAELTAAANCVMGSPAVAWKALALGRKFLLLYSPEHFKGHSQTFACIGSSWPNIILRPFDFKAISEVVGEASRPFKLEPGFLERRFFKFDRGCWRRMLSLAEELLNG